MSPRGTAAGAAWRRLLRGVGIDVRPGEGTVAAMLFLCFFLFITFQYTTKSVRQSTFIDELGAAYLPLAYLAVAAFSLPLLWLYSRVADRLPRHWLIGSTCLVIAGSLVACWWIFPYEVSWLPFVFYVWISIVYVTNVSQFWSFSNHVLDPRQAKRLFGFIGAGGLLGGVAGGQVARLVSVVVDTRSTFLVAAGILVAAAALILIVHRVHPLTDERGGATGLEKLDRARGGLAAVRRSRQLQSIGAVLVLSVMVAQFVDLQFNWAAETWTATTGLDQRTAFFGNFFSIMGISAFLFQLAFTARIHRRLGVGFAMRVLPTTMAVGTGVLFLTGAMFPVGLISAAYVLKIGENGLRYSLDQVTRELLFLPVPSRIRVKAKAYIDVFIQRGAKGLAGLLLLLVTFGYITELQTGWISLALIVVWFGAVAWAFREYVRSFRQQLKQRTVDVSLPIDLGDVTTLELLVQSLGSADPRQVLHGLEILGSHGRGSLVPPLLLYHDDAQVRRKTLRILAAEGRRDAVPLIERRLGDEDPEVRAEAAHALAELYVQDAATLMLPKLRDAHPAVRAAAVACVANHGDAEAVRHAGETLDDMLSDADPDVRAEAVKAIGAVTEPSFQGRLVQRLYDGEPRVAREAIIAVRRRATRDGFNPVYVPTLISLLRNRRLKHEARDALVALGEPVIRPLVHFMNDSRESVWVRRALPKTLARFGSREALAALVDALETADDPFLRRKVIEALGGTRWSELGATARSRIEAAIRSEAQGHAATVAALAGLGHQGIVRIEGARVVWVEERPEPDLLYQLLVERTEDHLRNLFALIALLHPPQHVWAAYRSLVSGRPALKAHALEFLDNTLTGDVRRTVFAVISDDPVDAKLRAVRRTFGLAVRPRVETLAQMLRDGAREHCDTPALTVAALYTVYDKREQALYDEVRKLAVAAHDAFVGETAGWVVSRLALATGS